MATSCGFESHRPHHFHLYAVGCGSALRETKHSCGHFPVAEKMTNGREALISALAKGSRAGYHFISSSKTYLVEHLFELENPMTFALKSVILALALYAVIPGTAFAQISRAPCAVICPFGGTPNPKTCKCEKPRAD